MKKILTLSLSVGFFAAAFGLATYQTTFTQTYKVSPNSTLGKAGCGLCHASSKGGKLNCYGKDIEAAMKGAKKMSAAHLKAVENMDSNKNGVKNIDEIKADKLPGG